MPPDRIMFIRRAEKPDEGKDGVAADGSLDVESLTVRGWQRAGALIAFFCAQPKMRPDAIFASGIGHGSKGKRSAETVTPLAAKRNENRPVAFHAKHLKDDIQPLMDQVLSLEDTVLVCWEHSTFPNWPPSSQARRPFPNSGRTTASISSGSSTAQVRAGLFRKYYSACFRKTATNRSVDRRVQETC
jgi:hypothetical protein